ncbi:unnamed protein product [Prunus brigantina]
MLDYGHRGMQRRKLNEEHPKCKNFWLRNHFAWCKRHRNHTASGTNIEVDCIIPHSLMTRFKVWYAHKTGVGPSTSYIVTDIFSKTRHRAFYIYTKPLCTITTVSELGHSALLPWNPLLRVQQWVDISCKYRGVEKFHLPSLSSQK